MNTSERGISAANRQEYSIIRLDIPIPVEALLPVRTLRRIAITGEPIFSGYTDDRWKTTVRYEQSNNPHAIIALVPDHQEKHGMERLELITDGDLKSILAAQITNTQGQRSLPLVLDEPFDIQQAIEEARLKEVKRVVSSFRYTGSVKRTSERQRLTNSRVKLDLEFAKRRGIRIPDKNRQQKASLA